MKYEYTDLGITNDLKANEKGEPVITYDQAIDLGTIARMDFFRKKMKSEEAFTMTFNRALKNGDVDTYRDGVHIVMKNEESPTKETRNRANKLMHEHEVMVVSIDEEKKEVYVSFKRAASMKTEETVRRLKILVNERAALQRPIIDAVEARVAKEVEELFANDKNVTEATKRTVLRSRVHSEVNKESLNHGIKLIVEWAIVKSIDRDGAIVDILGYSIPGYIRKAEWSYSHIENFKEYLKPGQRVDVAIISYGKGVMLHANKEMFRCARTPLIDDPWENKMKLTEGQCVMVKCTSVRAHNWFGTTEGFEAEIYGEMPGDPTKRVILGQTYNCYIYSFEPHKRKFKVRLFSELTGERKDVLK